MNWFIFLNIFAGLFFLFSLIDFYREKYIPEDFSKYFIFSGLWLPAASAYFLIGRVWGMP